MTSRGSENPSKLELALYRLRKIALDLESDGAAMPQNIRPSLSDEERAFIVNALRRIGEGKDPKQELGIVAKQGEHVSQEKAAKDAKIDMVVMFISTLTAPKEQGGGGMDFKDAIDKAAEHWGYDIEALERMYNKHPRKAARTMTRPIHTLPERN